jgi:AcrR family transcriptional regulator
MHQLPAGRHGLDRSFVVENQRERMLAAVADVTYSAGYAAMTVEDICSTAGVSRRTFYDHFKSKEDVYLAAFDAISAQLLESVTKAYDSTEGLVARAGAALQAFLDFIASEPTFADMCIVEVMAAGTAAVKRRNAAMQGFAALIQRAVDEEIPEGARPPELVAETIVGGIYEVVYSRVVQGRTDDLPGLMPDLLFSMLLPYIGHERAMAECRRARRHAKAS